MTAYLVSVLYVVGLGLALGLRDNLRKGRR